VALEGDGALELTATTLPAMSMWLSLAKISPEVLAEIRERPDLLDALFFEEAEELPEGVSRTSDMLGCDYLTLSAVADAKAREEFGVDDWREHLTWLVRATGEDEAEVLEGYEFTYGPAFVLTAPAVVEVAEGLAAEGWDFTDLDLAFEELDEDELGSDDAPDGNGAPPEPNEQDEDEDEDEDDPEYDDFVDLLPFFAAAAREGKAIVGGIS
jgi:hypothetical protein